MDNRERYLAALHAVQTGVKLELELDRIEGMDTDNLFKHLRTGNNARACDHTGLVKLLVAKGIITWEEYERAMADEMEAEVKRYEESLSEQMGGGASIKLA